MRDRGQSPERAGGVHQHVEPAEALMKARADRIDLVALRQIQRQQRGTAADRADRIVGLFQAALGARGDHHVRAKPRQFDGGRRADAAARAGDQRDSAR